MADCSTLRSFVSDCSMPLASPVRTIATRSVGSNPVSTNPRNARRVWFIPSTESPRSSTTRTIVRPTCSRVIGGASTRGASVAAGARTALVPMPLAAGAATVMTGTNCASVTLCRLPFWKTSKSAAVRSRTTSPLPSVTTASIDTTSTAILNLGASDGAWLAATAAAVHATTMNDTRVGVMRPRRIRQSDQLDRSTPPWARRCPVGCSTGACAQVPPDVGRNRRHSTRTEAHRPMFAKERWRGRFRNPPATRI